MLAPNKTFDAVKSSLALSRFISHGGLEATPSPPNVMAAHPPKRFGQVIALEKLFTRMSRSRTGSAGFTCGAIRTCSNKIVIRGRWWCLSQLHRWYRLPERNVPALWRYFSFAQAAYHFSLASHSPVGSQTMHQRYAAPFNSLR